MLKFNNYPPKNSEDVEFTDTFVKDHRCVQPSTMAKLVTSCLVENMLPEDRSGAPEIIAHLIETFPILEPSRGISAQLYGPNPSDQGQFVSSIEYELGQRLPLKTGAF